MRPLEQVHVPCVVLCALCVLAVVSPDEVPISEELKEKLRGSVAMIAVNSTPCSVTCGPGLRLEEMCEVTPAGERRSCSPVGSFCLGSVLCGLRHLSAPAGRPLRLGCLAPNTPRPGNHGYRYTWRLARGLITTSDLLFQPLRNSSPALSFSPVREAHAGTYRCDVQVLGSFKLVKRIYFGLRVIPEDLVDLSFQGPSSWGQGLVANLQGNGSWGGWERFWEKEEFYEAVLGIGSGVVGGILLSLLLCCFQRLWRRRGAEK